MNKEDLIYDAILRIEDRFDKEFTCVKKDIDDLKTFKNRALGIVSMLSLFISSFIAWIKSNF